MDYKHTCDTIFTHFQGITNNIYGFGRPLFCSFIFLPIHNPSTHIFTRPNDGWTGLYIKLWLSPTTERSCQGGMTVLSSTLPFSTWLSLVTSFPRMQLFVKVGWQGFMQNKIIASHFTHVLVDTWMLTLKC